MLDFTIIVYREMNGDALLSSEAETIHTKIDSALRLGRTVNLDFKNVRLITCAFLGTVLGKLLKDHELELVRQNISYNNVSSDYLQLINEVIENAYEFYKR